MPPPPDLAEKARRLRLEILEMSLKGGGGHLPSAFSMADLLVALFHGGVLRWRRGEPRWSGRDRLIVSKGHAAAALYPILADLDYFPRSELGRYAQPDGLLGIFADPKVPGIEAPSGSLGHGVGIGAGIAWAAKQDGTDVRAFTVLGDGECTEGSIWEAALFAAHQGLDNLVAVVDRNGSCILGHTEELVRLEPLEDKWRAFGWHTVRVDGHDFAGLLSAFALVGRTEGRPLVVIADTVKGKGVPFMEDRPEWHNRLPSGETAAQARRALGGGSGS